MKNRIRISIAVAITFFLVLGVLAFSIPRSYASPKSLYLVADHHTAEFDAWNIEADGTVSYQFDVPLVHATDPAGIAMDESSKTLFITSEFSGGVELIDATTMMSLGVSLGPSNLAGIDTDDADDIVYAVERATDHLYVFDWDPTALTLTPRAGFDPFNLPGCSAAFGVAFDNTTDILWVADSAAGIARAYDVNTWTEDMTKSFTPVHQPVDITVDRIRGFVYTVSMTRAASTPPGTGSTLLSRYDLATGTETTGGLADEGIGVAVDEVTGLVYVTVSPYLRGLPQGDLDVWDTTSWTQVQSTPVSGGPAGICIPRKEVPFNPLNLTKDDGLAGQCVNPGDTLTYTMGFNNTNPYTVVDVWLWDNMSDYVTFVSATGGGGGYTWSYDPGMHSVTWNIGDLPSALPDSVTLEVTVNSDTPLGSDIINYASIEPILMRPQGEGRTTVHIITKVCTAPPVREVYIDVKPASWPNPLQLNDKGVLPVAICGTEDFDITTIDPETVQLTLEGLGVGVSPLRWSYEDVATPYMGEPWGGHDYGADGYLDLTLKFKTQEVIETLGLDAFADGDVVIVVLMGNLKAEFGGTPIQGQDCVWILHK